MARRTLNHKALRADFDAAERRKLESTGGAESASTAETAPSKKKGASKTARPKRARASKSVRQRVVWGVFNNSNARIETFPFPQKQQADEYAAKLRAEKGSTFFVQPVKELIEDEREESSSRTSEDLHGSAPDYSETALLLIDVINDLDFPEGDQMLRYALPMAQKIAALTKQARHQGVPVVYVNDNFGRWRSDFNAQVQHCLRDGVRGKPLVELLRPEENDYFVLKPKHSGFFSTTLDTLLEYLGTQTVILAGLAANICVLFTANDAYMRDFNLLIPSDCVASNTVGENNYALEQMRKVLKADVRPSTEISLQALAAKSVSEK